MLCSNSKLIPYIPNSQYIMRTLKLNGIEAYYLVIASSLFEESR